MENDAIRAYLQGARHAEEGRMPVNSSDWWGPYCTDYEKGYHDGKTKKELKERKEDD